MKDIWYDGKDFVKLNVLYAPLLLIGIKFVISNIHGLFTEINNNIHTVDIRSLRKKYRGDWAFVADVSKPYGITCAALLAANGYNILTLSSPDSTLIENVKQIGKSLEVVVVSPFCSQFDPQDVFRLEQALKEKNIGVIIMNLFYESPCRFESEFPVALIGNVNASIIKTTLFLETLIQHVKKQANKAALVTTGSVLGETSWPGFQVTSGCAKSIEELTSNLKGNIEVLHIKSGYVPMSLRNSWYFVNKQIEARNTLMKIGVYKKAYTHIRIKMQSMFHCSKLGKANRFAYAGLGILQRYFF